MRNLLIDRRVWFVLALVATGGILLLLGGSGRAEKSGKSAESDCATVWRESRASERAKGHPDGEARRQADSARVDCEERQLPQNEAASGVDAACLKDGGRRNASASAEPSRVGIYFSCRGDVLESGHPLYLFEEEVDPGADTTTRLQAAISAYLEGPSMNQREQGYMTALPPISLVDSLDRVTIKGPTAVVSLNERFVDLVASNGPVGTSSGSLAFLDELGTTALQFDEIRRVEVQVSGDCEAFWRLLEMSCQVLDRALLHSTVE